MITFRQLDEALDRTYPATLVKRGKWEYHSMFKLDDGGKVDVDIEANDHIDDYDELDWEINFVRNEVDQGVTGEGDALKIMATVFKLLKDFIKKENPKYMNLSAAKKPDTSKTDTKLQGRERLYGRLVSKAVGNKYKVRTDTGRSGRVWYIERKS
jgi:hypothetical protein